MMDYGRKSISKGRASVLIFILAIGFSFAIYNFAIFWIQNHAPARVGDPADGHRSGWVDPIIRMPLNRKSPVGPRPKFHVAVTASDTPYSKWQCRVAYYWYKRVKDGDGSDMGGFTRILHSGRADNLMEEIPTFVTDPLPNGLDRGYVVLNRPWAFLQWLNKVTIVEEYVLMAEPDHIFLKPLPNLAYGIFPVGFSFFYIKPAENEKILRKFFPKEKGPIENIDPIGNSPVIILKSQLKEIVPTWVNVSLAIKNDSEADQTFGWVQEMYAYAVASALHGVTHILHKDIMVQPPFDREIADKYILHYTYANEFNMKGEMVWGKKGEWRFDKRAYLDGPPPKNLTLPPPGVPESVVTLVKKVNEAAANIPGWENL